MENEITVYDANQDMALTRAPEVVLAEAQRAAKALSDVVSRKKKPVIMNGEQYLEFEDWQTVGRFYGITAKVISTNFIEYGSAQGFEARAVALRSDGEEISAAEAMCLNDEANWKSKPLFQLRSMAQTRACAKALRNVLAWVVVLAGYRPTPAEEMQGVFDKPPLQEPKKKVGQDEPPPLADPSSELLHVTQNIASVTIRNGRQIITDGNKLEYATFDKKIAETAKRAMEAGIRAELGYKKTQYGKDLKTITLIDIPPDKKTAPVCPRDPALPVTIEGCGFCPDLKTCPVAKEIRA